MAGSTKTDGAHKTVQPSPELGAVVGNDPLKRTDVVSKIWEYIKKNNLQNEKDKRQIDADDKLEKVFGKKQVSMFEMNKLISAHLK
ncbi:SWIB/MDM2 domain-containing protein [Sphingomonas morindae]|uniref:SWIB/MDM2 domain-containing protein n=1 Tax=Sphingomonas morindae TaxID=1541170 RepID=A0ABY4XAE3_9SPHN|nr:SWIB/MDM2 domain-containing protein [Sphingomonas morindae]USI73845.1 SWIB/MDM2 domain-containing protein [Sphingomonas morindae]